MKKIVLADHHPLTRIGIKDQLLQANSNYSIIGEVSHGDKLLGTLKQKRPHLLVLELNMPGINGFQVLRDIKTKFPEIKIVIFSSYPVEIYALHCINSGANGYVHKTTSSKDFSKIVKSVISGETYINKKINKNSLKKEGLETIKDRYKKLSIRETEVLNLLLEGHRNKDIALQLDINEKTVSTYKSRLLKKLKVNNLAKLINHTNALSI